MEFNRHIMYKGHDVFLIPSKDSNQLLYAPTLRKLLLITEGLASRIYQFGLEKEIYHTDVQAVLSLLKKSLDNPIKPFSIADNKSRFFHLAIGLTKNCSLNCLYCHADAGKREEISQDILSKAIFYAFDTAQKNNLKRINISFAVGGEPTVNWKLFMACIQQLKESESKYGIPIHLSMTTNGYYGRIKREFIAKNLNSILISLDGPPEIQNLHRPSKLGKQSYPLVEESTLFFIQNIKSFAIRSTVSNHSVDKMPEIVEFFNQKFGNSYDLVFEPLIPLGRATINQSIITEPSQEEFVKQYIRAKELGNKLGLAVKTSAANHKRLVTGFCGAMSIPSFTVTTNGVVTTCERDSEGDNYWYGRFSDESKTFIFDQKRIVQNKTLLKMPEKCYSCFCKWHCAGDCPDVRSINYNRCYVNRSLVQYELDSLLTQKINNKGGNNDERKTSCQTNP